MKVVSSFRINSIDLSATAIVHRLLSLKLSAAPIRKTFPTRHGTKLAVLVY